MKKLFALLLAALMLTAFAGCGKDTAQILVAEKGSAGEEVAQTDDTFKDYEYTAVDSQAKALMEVSAGTADAAVVDYVMSIGSIGAGTDYKDLIVEGNGFAEESYGIAFRKGSDFTAKVNAAIAELKASGKLVEIAKKYKLQDQITATESSDAFKKSESNSDAEYIESKGKLIIGITYFAPMNYEDKNGKLTGFETEFATAVCEKLGLEPVFQEIEWDSKETELSAKNIDCIWNGMTINEERSKNMSITIPYMLNKQVKVVKSK